MPNDKYKEKIDQAVERLEQGIRDFFNSDHYRDYLQVMGKFHRYSVRNCILIASQRPDAGRVAGYNDWKKNFNRQVKKGEKGIMILAPYKRTIEVTLAGKYDSNGDPLKEKREITTFRPCYVFDEQQTEGEPLPEIVRRLDFQVDGYDRLMDALLQTAECPVFFETFPEDSQTNGYYNPVKNEIHIREGMSQAQTIKTLIHEESHRYLHPASLSDKSRNEKEVEAESCANIVSGFLGIETGKDYSYGYISSWAEGKNLEEMTECIENIKRGSDLLINKLDRILCLECTREEVEMEEKEEKAEQFIRDQGAEVESVTIVADQPRTLAIATVCSVEDEKKIMEISETAPTLDGKSISFTTLNVNSQNEPVLSGMYTGEAKTGRDSSWPMVSIRYTNVPGMIRNEMNIYEFRQMMERLPDSVLDNRNMYFKVCITYTYNDRNYQRMADIDLGHGRVDYLNYLAIEGNHIAYLKSHVNLLKACDDARHIVPKTEKTMEYEDSMQEWAGYCREILNHSSDRPVIPGPPRLETIVEKSNSRDWRLEL